jgi:aminopeptidase N
MKNGDVTHEHVLKITEAFNGLNSTVPARPIPSLLRGFSAPAQIEFEYPDAQLAALIARDSDGVVRRQSMRTPFFRAFDLAKAEFDIPALFDRAIESSLQM